MSPTDPPRRERPSTYFVQDRSSEEELQRLQIQHRMLTTAMGGVLVEQTDPAIFSHILDIGSGSGGWAIETALTYPGTHVTGIDISKRMVTHAREQAEAQQVSDRVQFHVMDALRMLEFPSASFDMVNLCMGCSYIRTWDWPKLLEEFMRVVQLDGIIRVTDTEIVYNTSSPSLNRFGDMLVCALERAGNYFVQEPDGYIAHLARILTLYGCQEVQTRKYTVDYRANTPTGQGYYKVISHAMRTLRPFFQKWGSITNDYDEMCQQALHDMQQPDFVAIGRLLTAWGKNATPSDG